MNRPLTALFSALEALLVVGVGIGIPLVPLTLMWAFQYGLQLDWIVFWRASVDSWLLGHGTDIRFTLDPAVAAATGLPGAGELFLVSIAPLGFALITLLLAVRAGRRIGETPFRHIGHLVSIGTFAVLALVVILTSLDPSARPSIVQGVLLPTLVFALGVAIGSAIARRRARSDVGTSVRLPALARLLDRAPHVVGAARVAVAGGLAAAMTLLAVSAVTLAVLVAVNYGTIIGLYEGVQSGYLGGAALTVGQLAALPNLVVFTASWYVGPGFAIGTGSAVSPLATALGPLPALPIFGALPQGGASFAFVGLLVPVLAGFLAAVVLRPRLVAAGWDSTGVLVATGVGMGITGGALLGALAWAASGAAGPGRLADVGPTWWLVALWAALEIAVPAVIALVVGGLRGRGDEAGPGDAVGSGDARAASGSRDEVSVETAPIPVV